MLVELTVKNILDLNFPEEKIWINLNHVERVAPYRGNFNFLVIYTVLGMNYYVEIEHWEEVVSLLQGGNKNGRFC